MVAVKTGMRTRSQIANETALTGGVFGQIIDRQSGKVQAQETWDLLCKLNEEDVPYDWANDYNMIPVFCIAEIPLEVSSHSHDKDQ